MWGSTQRGLGEEEERDVVEVGGVKDDRDGVEEYVEKRSVRTRLFFSPDKHNQVPLMSNS